MKIYISGGCKNGKSFFAQKIAKRLQKHNMPLYYLATMIPADIEDEVRIRRHLEEREGWGFETIEAASNIVEKTAHLPSSGSYLFDSVTALLANEMFTKEGVFYDSPAKAAADLHKLIHRVENIVLVSDFIYSDAQIFDEFTEMYKKGLAAIDRKMAKVCDIVIEFCYGNLLFYKGKELFGGLLVEAH